MKRTPIKRKPRSIVADKLADMIDRKCTNMLNRKSPLRKKPKAKSSAWFKRKVVEAFMAQFRGKPCAVCGTTDRTCGHHILAKGSHPSHIVSPENIVVLCQLHHRWSNDMSPHSTNQLAVERFCQWLKEHFTWQYDWCKTHEWDKIEHDWKELYETL